MILTVSLRSQLFVALTFSFSFIRKPHSAAALCIAMNMDYHGSHGHTDATSFPMDWEVLLDSRIRVSTLWRSMCQVVLVQPRTALLPLAHKLNYHPHWYGKVRSMYGVRYQ
ncbi:uncharacterized protein EURHEDRAFT_410869 [Aspergillus ruber CBS 135680]|uniref:Uncharacterized protein n=1 Tax=Aspergillus ruber (strain CBS 135680) TaxID=1388766 RepID=A0A017SI56_ASPRC|nr:uncharacterized protein EURHEDRAFT_410869 [Aspergillus ruber CBS 135680]EYE96349.1 hypothetical protein EURHEDRAFT_410869 [Aspergillus ruber CBS 135680]